MLPTPGWAQTAGAAAARSDAVAGAGTSAAPASPAPLPSLDSIAAGLASVERSAAAGRLGEARQAALRLYLDRYEMLESSYGVGGGRGTPELAAGIGAVEGEFHQLLRAADASLAAELARSLRAQVLALRPLAAAVTSEGISSAPGAGVSRAAGEVGAGYTDRVHPAAARTPAIRAILAGLDRAEWQYRSGRASDALAAIERLYLDQVEALEPRLPQGQVHELERLIHLGLRAKLARGAPRPEVEAAFRGLRAQLLRSDDLLSGGAPGWLGAVNAFVILVREGLEAVLLLAALLAYLAATGAGPRERRRIYAGMGVGIGATALTWVIARLVIPMGGASRELVEGVTGLVAVAVLIYVSNWLFQKTYIHDWKDYLRQRVGVAVSTGSGIAMAALAFAAVYREGFETVLFYQALLFDAGPGAVLAGAVPGGLAIGALAVAIIRLGVKLPLRRVFAATNAILLYLAFGFVGKGLYNLQEAGVFAPHPLAFLPDSALLRQLLGIYPIAETLAAQVLFAVGLLATYVYYRRGMRRRQASAAVAALPGAVRAVDLASTGS